MIHVKEPDYPQDKASARGQPREAPGQNDLLRQARLRTPSPSNSNRPMSQRELAEAVTAHVQRATGRDVALDRHDISRWERGGRRVRTQDYRNALRAVLGVATDAELGFDRKPAAPRAARSELCSTPSTPVPGSTSRLAIRPVGTDGSTVQLVMSPGTAIVLVPLDGATLAALVPALSSA